MIRDCHKRVDDGCRLLGIFTAVKLRHIRELSHRTSFRNDIYLIHGPNIGLGHTSVIHMMESQFRYILNAVTYSDENFGAAVEPTEDAQQRFVDQVDEATEGSVWTTGGCSSWYLDSTGRNSNLWPSSTVRYRAQTRRFVAADHTLTPAASLSRA